MCQKIDGYKTFADIVSVPYHNQTLKTDYLNVLNKNMRQQFFKRALLDYNQKRVYLCLGPIQEKRRNDSRTCPKANHKSSSITQDLRLIDSGKKRKNELIDQKVSTFNNSENALETFGCSIDLFKIRIKNCHLITQLFQSI